MATGSPEPRAAVGEESPTGDALRSPDRIFDLAMKHSGIGMALVAPDGSFMDVNAALCNMLGRTEEQLRASTWQELTHPDDVEIDIALVREVLDNSRDSYRLNKRYLRPDGSVVHGDLSVACVRGDDGAVQFFVSQIVDTSAQVEALENYELLARNVSDVVALGSTDGRLTWVSPSVTALMGWRPQDLVGMPFRDIVHPDDVATVSSGQARLAAGESASFEVRMRHRDGDFRWMSLRVRPVVDDHGAIVARVAAWWDTHARHLAIDELEASEARFRAAIDAELDAHVFLEAVRDTDGRIVDFTYTAANARAQAYVSLTHDELIGRRMLDLFPGQADSGLFERYIAATDTGEPLVLDAIEVASEVAGAPRNFDFRGVRVGDGLSLTWRDVTDRVTAENTLAESQQRYRLLAENASDVVFRGSPQAVLEWVSPSVVDVLGRTPEELIGHPVSELIHPDDAANLMTASREANSGNRVSYRARYATKAGEWRWVEVTARPVRDESGEVVARVGSLRDVHEQALAEQALARSERQAHDLAEQYERARNEALEANLAKTTFLSRMSHELRTPLNSVLGFAQLLAMDPLTEEQFDAVEHIRRGGRHLLDLIGEILDISRIEAGRLSLSMESVRVADAVGEAFDLVGPIAADAGVTLATDREPCELSIWADRQRVIQILLNLLTNAVKYNHPGGSVTVTCEAAPGHLAAIRVADTGMGIPADSMHRLFEPFDRLGAEATRIEGTGIGLALSQGLAQAMSGRIDVESESGRGSVFSLVLPRSEPHESPSAQSALHSPSTPGRNIRVLYVEDNPANRDLMARVVALRQHAVMQVAADGQSGLAAAAAEPPDLVLLDLHLPDISGEEVLRRLRATEATARTPVVVVTADASSAVRTRMLALGADAVLNKPIDVGEVLDWIDDPQGRRPAE